MSAGHRAIFLSSSLSPFCKGRRALLVRLAWLQTKLIEVEICSVARQVIHSQLAVEFRCVFLDRESLVGRSRRPHRCDPEERAFRTDGRRGTDALTLADN